LYVTVTLILWAVLAVAEVLVSSQSPAAMLVADSVLAGVVPSMQFPITFAHAGAPALAVAREVFRLVSVPLWFTATTTAGVPASAATVTSITVEARGMKHCLPWGAISAVASEGPLSAPMMM
jgi:hypothetical protein